MSALNFPDDQNPQIGDTYFGDNGVLYTYDGVKWIGQINQIAGPSGPSGATGIVGPSGATGPSGPPDGPQGPSGATGPSGPRNGILYTFSTSTSLDPGAGKISFNNFFPSSTSQIQISQFNFGAADLSNWIDFLDSSGTNDNKGTLYLQSNVENNIVLGFTITGVISTFAGSPFNWFTIPVSHIFSSGVFTDNEIVSLNFVAAGTPGPSGPESQVSGPSGPSGPEGPPGVGSDFVNPYNNVFTITNVVSASSTSSGALEVYGGVKVRKQLRVESDVNFIRNTHSSQVNSGVSFNQHHEISDAVNFNFYRSRGTEASPTIVQINDDLGEISFIGYDGSNPAFGAGFSAKVEGPINSSLIATKLSFSTTNGEEFPRISAELSSTGTWKIDRLASLTLTNILVSSSLIPTLDSLIDLGSTSSQWRSLYVSSSTIYIGGVPVTVTNGDLQVNGNPVLGASGPSGPDGPSGAQGVPGQSVQITGSTATSTLLEYPYGGNDGDGFIVQDTGNLWVYASGTWTSVGQIVGPVGPSGPEGPAGIEGPSGLSGVSGPSGPSGVSGPSGLDSTIPGPSGPSGVSGPSGLDSTIPGPSGPSGPSGVSGPSGLDSTIPGPSGPSGVSGPSGPSGVSGPSGLDSTIPGPIGPQGDIGPSGPSGPDGVSGPSGPSGPESQVSGPSGPTGPSGPSGIGPTGPSGPSGVSGPSGIGPTGPSGPSGPATFFSFQSASSSTTSINIGTTATLEFAIGQAYILTSISADNAAWVRVYTSSAARSADLYRDINVDPGLTAGVIAEAITTASETISFAPAPFGYNDDLPSKTDVAYVHVTNRGTGAATINVTLSYITLIS